MKFAMQTTLSWYFFASSHYFSIFCKSSGELDGSDLEMDELEGGEPRLALHGAPRPRPLPSGSELVLYQEAASAVVPTGETPTTPDTPTQDHLSPLALPPPTTGNMLVPVTQSGSPGRLQHCIYN